VRVSQVVARRCRRCMSSSSSAAALELTVALSAQAAAQSFREKRAVTLTW